MELIGQRYEIVRELGTGGTATVYEARDRVLSRTCAVKLLSDVGQGKAAATRKERLRTEAMALATLDHARVVRVYDLGEHEGQPFLAMEYLEGGSLADALLASGPMRPAEAVDRMLEVLDALGAAHDAGIVHRDVKPHNVLLRADGTAALADFGIARQEARSHTRTGVALGSIDYMAPEQRVDARRVGPSADVYGAGCTLFHLLTAETPVDLYLAPDHSPRWEGVPAALLDVVRRATSVDPGDRDVSAAEMAGDLLARRESVADLPPRQPGFLRRTPGSSGTRVDGPPTKMELVPTRERQGHMGAEEYGWAKTGGPRVGQQGVVVGVVLAVALAVVAFMGRPVVDDLVKKANVRQHVEVEAPIDVIGVWVGPFGGSHHGRLELFGEPSLVTADLVVDLDGHKLRAKLVGRFDPSTASLKLRDASGELTGAVDPRGMIVGEFQREGGKPMGFAVVRAPPE